MIDSTATQSPVISQHNSSTKDNNSGFSASGPVTRSHSDRSSLAVLLSVKEAARRLNVSPKEVYRMDRIQGPFPIVKIGWRVFVGLAGLESYLETRGDTCTAPEPVSEQDSNEHETLEHGDETKQGTTECSLPQEPMPDPNIGQSQAEPTLDVPGFGNGQRDLCSLWVLAANRRF